MQGRLRIIQNQRVLPHLAICLALSFIVLFVFWQTGRFEFTFVDDPEYVTGNNHVLTGLTANGIQWAFTTFHAANWHPLTWLSHQLDAQLFGLNPKGHHLSSVAFHILNSILLFLALSRMTGALWKSAFVAALFAVHPLHVESVAWVAERKDVLSTAFWLLALYAYAEYSRKQTPMRYAIVVLLHALGLMAKSMTVTLPFVLLLLDYWPLKRLIEVKTRQPYSVRWNVVREKIPLIFLSILSSIVTFLAQRQGGAVGSLEVLTYYDRLNNALISYAAYLLQMLWPDGLACFYPLLPGTLAGWQSAGSFALIVSITIMAWKYRAGHPYLWAGWMWYIGTLIPVIGIIQVGAQARADRYTYIPLIGLFIAIAWLVPALVHISSTPNEKPNRDHLQHWRTCALAIAAVLIIGALAWQSHVATGYWMNTKSLAMRALSVTSDNPFAHGMLAAAYLKEGRGEDAIQQARAAVALADGSANLHQILGLAYLQQMRLSDASAALERAVSLNPRFYLAHKNLADVLLRQGKFDETIRELGICAELAPGSSDMHTVRGLLYVQKQLFREALREFEAASKLDPRDPIPYVQSGIIHDKQGLLDEAAREFAVVLKLNPDDFDGHNNLGYVHGKLGMLDDAVRELQAAMKILPDHPEPHNNLGEVYRKQKRLGEAERHLKLALGLQPGHAEAHNNLGKVYLDQMKVAEAIREFKEAVKLDPQYAEAGENLRRALAR